MEIGVNKEKMSLIMKIDSLNKQLTQLLIEKSDTVKSAIYLKNKYIMLVGKYEIARYKSFFEYEKIKRMIELYQRAINREESISEDMVEEIINKETKEYEMKLNEIIYEYSYAQLYMESDSLNNDEIKKIKEVYRYIVKLIHPDLHPNISDDFIVLWNMTQKAYTENDLEGILTIKEILDNKTIVNKNTNNEIEQLKDSIIKLTNKVNNCLQQISKMKQEYPFDRLPILNDEKLLNKKIEEIVNDTDEYNQRIIKLSKHLELLRFKADGEC